MKQSKVKCNECNELINVYTNNRFMTNYKIRKEKGEKRCRTEAKKKAIDLNDTL